MTQYPPYQELCRGLRDLRKAAGETQEELGAAVGVTGATISRWESGEHIPQKSHLQKLEEHFGLPFKTLVDRYVDLGSRRQVFGRWNAEANAWPIQLGPHRLRLDEDGNLLVNETTVILNPHRDGGRASE